MADCELCGAMKVGTRAVIMGRAEVQACKRCTEKMGLQEKKVAPGLSRVNNPNTTSGGYGGIGRKGKDIMLREKRNWLPISQDVWPKQELPKAGTRENWPEEWLRKSISSIMLNLESDLLMLLLEN